MEAQRLRAREIAPDAARHLRDLDSYIRKCGLERNLIELVKMRASQINGCAYCLDSHSWDARRGGESEQRLYLLNAWRESGLYSARERAALAWTEAVTDISQTHAPDDAFAALRPHFSDRDIVDLTVLVGLINLWNRLAIGFRYQPSFDVTKAA